MTFAALEPSVFNIKQSDWAIEQKRDDFIEYFHMVMTCIADNDEIALAWSDAIDEHIWSSPQSPPWRQDKDWAIPLIPIIYKKIQSNADYMDIDPDSPLCDIQPALNSDNPDLLIAFKQILACLHGACDKILIPIGLENHSVEEPVFTVESEALSPEPVLLTGQKDFLNQVDVAATYWPQSVADVGQLKQGIAILLSREYDIEIPPMDYSFSVNFMKKLINTRSDHNRILVTMAKRLSMTTAQAGRDGALHDENLTGQEHIRRFRVTQRPTSKRMHYTFKDGLIEFVMFYDAGEHDDGL